MDIPKSNIPVVLHIIADNMDELYRLEKYRYI